MKVVKFCSYTVEEASSTVCPAPINVLSSTFANLHCFNGILLNLFHSITAVEFPASLLLTIQEMWDSEDSLIT